jgi:hypothetical protein
MKRYGPRWADGSSLNRRPRGRGGLSSYSTLGDMAIYSRRRDLYSIIFLIQYILSEYPTYTTMPKWMVKVTDQAESINSDILRSD